ncbi:hypothetical protein WG66_014172 [Moniliophthora roreri]|nr:hypothetical protein WG66_014172 [Moniliophthora roreri]
MPTSLSPFPPPQHHLLSLSQAPSLPSCRKNPQRNFVPCDDPIGRKKSPSFCSRVGARYCHVPG